MLHNTNNSLRFIIFIIGIIATIAYRIIVVFNNISPAWVDVAWYLGTLGFIIHFGYRWYIENKRDHLIENLGLTDKVKTHQPLTIKDREAIAYVLDGIENSYAKWNYIAIFVASAAALIYAVWIMMI
jgi:hypothetical protein